MSPAEIQREFQIPYYNIRQAKQTMVAAKLSDAFLERFRLTSREKELLRHLQTLLCLVRDLSNEPERGPFLQQGLLIRYYRILHQVSHASLQTLYRSNYSIIGVTEIELGWAAVLNEELLLKIARAIKVPEIYESALVDYLFQSYQDVRTRIGRPAPEIAIHFPNEAWALPYSDADQSQLEERLKQIGMQIRAGYTRPEFAAIAHIKEQQIRTLENKAALRPSAYQQYVQYLKAEGRAEDARQLGGLRAALDLARNPIPDRGAFFEAGRLIRFTRFLVPGTTLTKLRKALFPDVAATTHNHWEWGLRRMPSDLLRKYAAFLVDHDVITAEEAADFVRHIEAIYSR